MMKFYPNFLPDHFIEMVLKNNELATEDKFLHSDNFWDERLRRPGSNVKIRFLSNKKTMILKMLMTESGLISNDFKGKFTALTYQWAPLSYVPWHNDWKYEAAVTIYLNKDWNNDWGGLLLIKNEETGKIEAFPPTYNTAVVNNSKVEHATTMLTPDAPIRHTIQCFWEA